MCGASQRAERAVGRAGGGGVGDGCVGGVGCAVAVSLVDVAGGDLSGSRPRGGPSGRGRETHPAIMSTFAAGAISMDQAAVATKAPAYLDEHLAETVTVRDGAAAAHDGARRPQRPTGTDEPRARPDRVVGRLVRRRRPLPPARRARRRPRSDRRRRPLRGPRRPVQGRPDQGRRGPTRWWRWPSARSTRWRRGARERFRVNWFVDPTDPIPAHWTDGLAVPGLAPRHAQLRRDGRSGVHRRRPAGLGRAHPARGARPHPPPRARPGSQVSGSVVLPDPLAAGPSHRALARTAGRRTRANLIASVPGRPPPPPPRPTRHHRQRRPPRRADLHRPSRPGHRPRRPTRSGRPGHHQHRPNRTNTPPANDSNTGPSSTPTHRQPVSRERARSRRGRRAARRPCRPDARRSRPARRPARARRAWRRWRRVVEHGAARRTAVAALEVVDVVADDEHRAARARRRPAATPQRRRRARRATSCR